MNSTKQHVTYSIINKQWIQDIFTKVYHSVSILFISVIVQAQPPVLLMIKTLLEGDLSIIKKWTKAVLDKGSQLQGTSINNFFRNFFRIKQLILALRLQNKHWTISKMERKIDSKSSRKNSKITTKSKTESCKVSTEWSWCPKNNRVKEYIHHVTYEVDTYIPMYDLHLN